MQFFWLTMVTLANRSCLILTGNSKETNTERRFFLNILKLIVFTPKHFMHYHYFSKKLLFSLIVTENSSRFYQLNRLYILCRSNRILVSEAKQKTFFILFF